MDILGQLRKLVALTFRTGTGNETITFKSTEGDKKPQTNLTIEIVKSPDDEAMMPNTHEMVTDKSQNELLHKTIELADTTNLTENYITGIKDIVPISSATDLEINRHYLTDSSGGVFVINLPSVITLDPSVIMLDPNKSDKLKERAIIRISDATGSWSENAVTVMPAAGEKINELEAGEGFILDVSNSWVELTWNDTLQEWTVNLSGAVKDFLQNPTNGEDQNLTTADIGTGTVKTGSINITTGDQSGTGDSGDINLTTGSAGGTQGEITLNSKKLSNNVQYRETLLQGLPVGTTPSETYGIDYYWENTDSDYVYMISKISPNNVQVEINNGVGHKSGNNADFGTVADSNLSRNYFQSFHTSGKFSEISVDAQSSDSNIRLNSTDKITFQNGSQGTIGHVWTSVNTIGGGEWKAPAAWSTSVVSLSLTAANYNEIITDGTAGITITLPDPSVVGTRIRVIDGANNWAINNVTVARFGSENINFSATDLTLNVNGLWVELVSDGTNWLVLTA